MFPPLIFSSLSPRPSTVLYPGHTSIQCFILFAFFFFKSTHFGVIWLSPRTSGCWGGACAWCCWVAPLGLCVLPLCMLDCNEATSLNCSEGWLSQREPYYTLGSICTRLFFLLLLLHPIFLTPSLQNLLLATDAPSRGAGRPRQTSLFFSDGHTNHHSVSKPDSPEWLCVLYG